MGGRVRTRGRCPSDWLRAPTAPSFHPASLQTVLVAFPAAHTPSHTSVYTLAWRLIQDPVLVLLPPFEAKKRGGVSGGLEGCMGGEQQEKGEGKAAVKGPGIKGRAETWG